MRELSEIYMEGCRIMFVVVLQVHFSYVSAVDRLESFDNVCNALVAKVEM